MRDRLMLTPHAAFYSEESERDMRVKATATVRAVLDGGAAQKSSRILKGTNTFFLLLAVVLLIAGFPCFLFGVFLAVSPGQNGIGGDVAFRFSFGGLVSVLCALVIRAYLRRRDGWF